MRTRKTTVRTCVGCRQTGDKRELIRIVRSSDGDIAVDPTGKANGRGAYVHASDACFESALKRRGLAGALKVTLTEEDVEQLRRSFEPLLTTDQATQER